MATTFADLPKSMSEARSVGSRHYFTGRPCPRGHVAPRFTSNQGCCECLKLGCRGYYERNRWRERERNRRHVQDNPEANRVRSWRYNRQRDGGVTREAWLSLLAAYDGRCACCGSTDRVELDHVVPLSCGGADHISNVQPLCKRCNSGKKNRAIDYRRAVDGR